MECLIIDDNKVTAEHLSELLARREGNFTIHQSVHPYQLKSILSKNTIEIVFVRVRLWNHTLFASSKNMPVIVFICDVKDKITDQAITTVPYRLREGFKMHELEALLKKIAVTNINERPGYFFVRFAGRYHRLFFDELEMIERLQMGYLKFYTANTEMLISGAITQWMTQLPEGAFVRVSDTLILPTSEAKKVHGKEYVFRNRKIELTFRFAKSARKELEEAEEWNRWAGQD